MGHRIPIGGFVVLVAAAIAVVVAVSVSNTAASADIRSHVGGFPSGPSGNSGATPNTSSSGGGHPNRDLASSVVNPGGPHVGSGPLVEVNLISANYVSSDLVYQGDLNGERNSTFPTLLEGSQSSSFWSGGNVLELAPSLVWLHASGIALFSQTYSTSSVTINSIVTSNTGGASDGVLAYFFVRPLATSQYSVPYFASSPELGNKILGAQGDVIFPFSLSPYVVVNWEPWGGAHFNVFVVSPAADGSVTASDIQAQGGLGTVGSALPSADDHLDFDATINLASANVQASVVDETSSGASFSLSYGLGALGFSTTALSAGTEYYSALGGQSNHPTGWGLLYLSEVSPPVSASTVVVLPTPSAPAKPVIGTPADTQAGADLGLGAVGTDLWGIGSTGIGTVEMSFPHDGLTTDVDLSDVDMTGGVDGYPNVNYGECPQGVAVPPPMSPSLTLPQSFSSLSSLWGVSSYSVSNPDSVTSNFAYDIWLTPTAPSGTGCSAYSQPTVEIMVWFYWAGGDCPAGSTNVLGSCQGGTSYTIAATVNGVSQAEPSYVFSDCPGGSARISYLVGSSADSETVGVDLSSLVQNALGIASSCSDFSGGVYGSTPLTDFYLDQIPLGSEFTGTSPAYSWSINSYCFVIGSASPTPAQLQCTGSSPSSSQPMLGPLTIPQAELAAGGSVAAVAALSVASWKGWLPLSRWLGRKP